MTEPMINLNITDITDAVRVIDYASEQGAFRGWDNIRQIIALRDRLDLFITAANGANAAATETTTNGSSAPDVSENQMMPPPTRRRARQNHKEAN